MIAVELKAAYDRDYRVAHREALAVKRHERYVANRAEELAISKKYAVAHRAEIATYKVGYYIEHREELNERGRNYHAEHREDDLARERAWRETHQEEIAAYSVEYALLNREAIAAKTRNWKIENPLRVLINNRKHKAKRRILGFVPLNQPFDGCNGHHIDRERVAYIPEVLHMSIRHNVWNGHNMAKINAVAFNFLFKQEVEAALGGTA